VFENAPVHRSSLKDWAGNETEFARELIEESLAHAIPNKVERADRRQAAISKRRHVTICSKRL
jgi:hypothetical protein